MGVPRLVIPLVEKPEGYHAHHIALYNTVLALKPRCILEIGTWKGTTAAVCARAQEAAGIEDGYVLTADIARREMCAEFLELEGEQVAQVIVYPHSDDIFNHYAVPREAMHPDWEDHLHDSLEMNEGLIREAMDRPFDFAFVDGDHSRVGLLRDLELVRRLTRPPHYALLDDVGGTLPSAGLYRGRLRWMYEHYDFEDWGGPQRLALIWSA